MILKLFKTLIVFAILGCAWLVVYQVALIKVLGGKTSYANQPFQRTINNARLHFLFVGDSTAVGTGTKDGSDSVAGWFAKDFPDADIENYGQNGKRLATLLQNFYPGTRTSFDLVVVQVGGNDIMRFTPYFDIERDIAAVVDKAKKLSKNVIILHSGRVGLAPIFSWPFNEILIERASRVRDIYIRVAILKDVHYVDLFVDRDKDIFLTDINKYYSPDRLHPSGEGYHWWYERIRETMKEAKIDL